MYSHEKKEEGQCCLANHKHMVMGCLAAMALVKIVFIGGIICAHKCHHQECCKKEKQIEE
ncbi:MAG: hypothetical protein JJE18_03000 [Eubacteriaceae bacterium]|nr:hypothetical protein [Eubacteriaceae bacterium]